MRGDDSPGGSASRRSTGHALAAATAVVSGISVSVNGRAVSHFSSPTEYTTMKNVLAGLGLLAVAALAAQRSPARRRSPVSLREFVVLSVVALLGGGVAFVMFFEGLATATSSDAAFVHKTLVVWACLLAVVVLGERVGAVQVGAVALLIGGHVVLADGIGGLTFGRGELLILGATLIWSVEVVAVRWLLRTRSAPSTAATRVAGGAAALVVWALVRGDGFGLLELSTTQLTWVVTTATLLVGFVTLWYAALAHAPVADVTSILVLGAVLTGLIEAGVADAPIGARLPGWILITIGVGLVVVQHALRPPTPSAARARVTDTRPALRA